MKKKFSTIIICILFLAGLSLLLYPFVANQWNNHRQAQLINRYDEVVQAMEETGKIDYPSEWEKAQSYNADLLPSILPDSFAVAEASEGEDERYMSCLNISEDGMMGTVEIPKIDVMLPIYHTTEEDVLSVAAGHLEGSSLPIGGETSHAVISAHRGLPSATLFTDLDKMEEGDHFFLHILDETLAYEVDMISVVEPEETDNLAVVQGEDLVTLLTCTPYGVNTQRLLVRGHRVPYEESLVENEESPLGSVSLRTNYLLWVIVGLAVTGAFILLLYILDRKHRRAAALKATRAARAALTEEEDKKE
ncbi:MAG: class C sortase [Lachnospiraceae bacterium]|nr:class C sortase [Lachnospiraceae bacterium]